MSTAYQTYNKHGYKPYNEDNDCNCQDWIEKLIVIGNIDTQQGEKCRPDDYPQSNFPNLLDFHCNDFVYLRCLTHFNAKAYLVFLYFNESTFYIHGVDTIIVLIFHYSV